MRTLNEAWRVLGDQARRTGYDDELDLAVRGHQASTGGGVSVQDGVTRIDPRLLDPEFLRTQRQYQSDVIDNRRAMALRFGPWIGLVALVIGIFIFTAYQGPGPGQPGPTTVAGPDLGVDANACVRVIGGPQLIEIPCTGVYDGRVIGAYEVGGACPDPRETIREVELSNGITACLGQ